MKKIKIVVDSTFNLHPEFVKKHDITVVPLNIMIDDISYKDKLEISLEEVMTAVSEGRRVSTSQPAPSLFIDVFEKLKEEGATDIICLTISSTLSGTYQSAHLASSHLEGINIHIIDTLTTSVGAEILTKILIDKLAGPGELESIITDMNLIRHQGAILMNFNDLSHLVSSGRMSRIRAALGNLLRIRPVIECLDGSVDIVKKKRSNNSVFEYIINRIKETFSSIKNKAYIIVGQVRNNEVVDKLVDILKIEFPKIEITSNVEISPVVAINLGYSGFGVGFYHY